MADTARTGNGHTARPSWIRRALGAGLTSLLVVVGALAGQSPAYAADPDPGVDRVVALLGGSGGTRNLAAWTTGLAGIGAARFKRRRG